MDRQEQPDARERDLWAMFRGASPPPPGPCPEPALLAAYADGRCAPEEVERVEEHLSACRDCLDAVLEARQAAQEAVRFVPPEVTSAAKGLVRPAGRPAAGSRVRWVRAAAWAAAAVVALAVGAGGFWAGEGTYRCRQQVSATAAADAAFDGDGWSLDATRDDFDDMLLAGGPQ